MRNYIALSITTAAFVAIVAVFVFHHDTLKSLREAHSATDKEHADTLEVLKRTDSQIEALEAQTAIMQGQLDAMQTESAVEKYELAARAQLEWDSSVGNGVWQITPSFANVGKTDGENYRAWDSMKIFSNSRELENFNFISVPTNDIHDFDRSKSGTIFGQGSKNAMPTKHVKISDGWDVMYEKMIIIIWGYSEFTDIFKASHTSRFCDYLHFIYAPDINRIDLTLPVPLKPECNQTG
jgi:hypothetical protein